MTRKLSIRLFISLAWLIPVNAMHAQTAEKPDLSKQPTLYAVGYAHLDTEWRWEYPQVISEYIRKTMEDNFTTFSISAGPIGTVS
jgi:alpha-mannosidase